MPLSKCRWCGKMIPNIFHKYHERVKCIAMRKAKGIYVSPESLREQAKREKERIIREQEEAKRRPQKQLAAFC